MNRTMTQNKLRKYLLYSIASTTSYIVFTLLMDKIMANQIDYFQLIAKGVIFGVLISLFLTSRYFRFRA